MVQLLLIFGKRTFLRWAIGYAGILSPPCCAGVRLQGAQGEGRRTASAGPAAGRRPQAALGAQFQFREENREEAGVLHQAAGCCHRRARASATRPSIRYRGRFARTGHRYRPGCEWSSHLRSRRAQYKFIERRDKDKDAMRSPQCIAVDAQDNFYVTDLEAGKIFVFDSWKVSADDR